MPPEWPEPLAWSSSAIGFLAAVVTVGDVFVPGQRRRRGRIDAVCPLAAISSGSVGAAVEDDLGAAVDAETLSIAAPALGLFGSMTPHHVVTSYPVEDGPIRAEWNERR